MKTALLVLDLINDIVSPNGKIPTCASEVAKRHVIQKANVVMQFVRSHHWPVLLVKVGFSEHYLEHPEHSPVFSKAKQFQALSLSEWGTQFHDDLQTEKTDYVIVKHRVSPFYGTALELILKNNKITRLLVCGVSSTWAVQAAVRDAHDRDYEVIIIEDACAAVNEAEHQLSMQQLSRIAKVITTKELSTL